MKKWFLLLVIAPVFLVGCASINSVSLTSIPADRRFEVKTERSKVIFLGLNFSNDFVDDAVEDLKQQCPNGKVTGLLTKDEDINYFLFIVWKKQVTATGFCVKTASVSAAKGRFRGTAAEDSGSNDSRPDSAESEL